MYICTAHLIRSKMVPGLVHLNYPHSYHSQAISPLIDTVSFLVKQTKFRIALYGVPLSVNAVCLLLCATLRYFGMKAELWNPEQYILITDVSHSKSANHEYRRHASEWNRSHICKTSMIVRVQARANFNDTVPLIYNFTFTCVYMHGTTQYLASQNPWFAVEKFFPTRRVVASRVAFHDTGLGISTIRVIP